MATDKRVKGCSNPECVNHVKKIKMKAEDAYCPKCGAELIYDRYVGFMNGDAYHEYDCTNPECDFTGRIFKENIYE